MELSGRTIIYGALFVACATLFALLCLGAWLLQKVLPDGHPLKSILSAEKLLHAVKVLGAMLIAAYFAGAIILYG
jgi:hypothetical protein